MRKPLGVLVGVSLALMVGLGCDYPVEGYPEKEAEDVVSTDGVLKTINGGEQICNPSISQDTVSYPGCMLWLGFDALNVNVPPAFAAEYSISSVAMHDRLTVTDSSNTVRWYLLRSSVPDIQGEMQDPEWTTHPDYITFLGKDAAGFGSGHWDGYVVRVSDKAVIKFSEDILNAESTPHVWVGGPTATPHAPDTVARYANGLLCRDSIRQFFGTENVKITYSKGSPLSLYYVDYALDSVKEVQLPRPEDRAGYRQECALISPDGGFVVYNCYTDPAIVECYAQRLAPGAKAQFIAEGAEPHWWTYGGREYVIYSTEGLLDLERFEDGGFVPGSAGYTMRQEVDLEPTGPGHIAFQIVGDPVEILDYPFKGGLSPDGYYICTGYQYAYMFCYY
ncbi:MAG: hypothetical protein GF331_09845 [Chitinivibrionales bacterium]|nr:hypothetical protein [Chitinivibrionales bacterium]